MGAVGAFLKSRPGAVGLAPANPALPTAGGLPSVGGSPRRHAAAGRRECSPAAAEGLVAVTFRQRGTPFHAPRPSPPPGNGAVSGAETETLATLEPRRRVRLPEKAMSEGAHHTETPAIPTAATERPATARSSLSKAGPERADEGGGPTTGRIEVALPIQTLQSQSTSCAWHEL